MRPARKGRADLPGRLDLADDALFFLDQRLVKEQEAPIGIDPMVACGWIRCALARKGRALGFSAHWIHS